MVDALLVIPGLILVQVLTYISQRFAKGLWALPMDCLDFRCAVVDGTVLLPVTLALLLTIHGYYRWRGRSMAEDFSWRFPLNSWKWIVGTAALALLYFPIKHGPSNWLDGMSKLGFVGSALRMFYILPDELMSVIREEFFERGAIQSSLTRALSERKAIVITSCFFAATHIPGFAHGAFAWWRIGLVFLLGLLFGTAYQKSRCILVPTAMHLLWNLIARISLLSVWSG